MFYMLGKVLIMMFQVLVYNESISKIALAAQVIDFDSGNSGRDSHSLEVLEALKFPNIKFYSKALIQR